jgi:long-chain acyl-CoA synthetase
MTDAKPWPAMSIAESHAKLSAPGARFEVETVEIGGVSTKVFKNCPPTLRQVFAAARAFGPGRTFIVYEDERASYEAFARAALAIAADLQTRGVSKGDRVAIVMRNLPEWVAAFHAAAMLGAIVTPLNAWWTGPELEFGLIDSGARIAIMDHERYERLADHLSACPALEHTYVARAPVGLEGLSLTRLEALTGPVNGWETLPDRPMPEVDLGPEDPALIGYTSGTTGRPKGALLTHRNVTTNIMSGALTLARRYLRRGETPPVPGPAAQRTTLLVVPLFHVTGLCSNLGPLMNMGGKLVLMHRWDAEKALGLIEREKVNQTGGVPTIAWQLIEHPDRAKYDLSSLDGLSYGGAPSAPELVRLINETFPKVSPGNAWGMTETSATFSGHSGEDYLNRPWSCGVANPTGEIKVIDPASPWPGVALGVGEIGELCAKGPQVVREYWHNPEASAAAFHDGWVRTGDLASIDAEGFITISDRAKDMLIRGGENIYCVEVENVLYQHPAVMDAALIGRPHRTLGEEPLAVVALAPGETATEAELRDLVRSKLAAFKVPVAIHFWPEMLPRNASGKILKSELKAALLVDGA